MDPEKDNISASAKIPKELHDESSNPAYEERIKELRNALITTLKDRPEGFSDGTQLITGCPLPALYAISKLGRSETLFYKILRCSIDKQSDEFSMGQRSTFSL